MKTIILGPPGTGKTTTLLNLVDEFIKHKKLKKNVRIILENHYFIKKILKIRKSLHLNFVSSQNDKELDDDMKRKKC